MMSDIQVRMTKASDVDAAVPLIYSSGPYSFNYAFCQSHEAQAREFLGKIFIKDNTEFSHRQHLGLYLNEQLVAVGCIRIAEHNQSFMLATLKEIISFYGIFKAIPVLIRGLRTEAVIRPPHRDAAVLCDLGVDEKKQGLGLGTQLIESLEQRAKSLGYDTVELDVASNNPLARALYQRLGYQALHTSESKLRNAFGFVPPHTRMAKQLS